MPAPVVDDAVDTAEAGEGAVDERVDLHAVADVADEGHDVPYSVLGPGQRSYALIRDGQVDIMQSAVSSNWNARERGVEPLPVHFAQINTRDGFFLVGREPAHNFNWKDLEGRSILADHGLQRHAVLRLPLFSRLAHHVFFGRGSFPDVELTNAFKESTV